MVVSGNDVHSRSDSPDESNRSQTRLPLEDHLDLPSPARTPFLPSQDSQTYASTTSLESSNIHNSPTPSSLPSSSAGSQCGPDREPDLDDDLHENLSQVTSSSNFILQSGYSSSSSMCQSEVRFLSEVYWKTVLQAPLPRDRFQSLQWGLHHIFTKTIVVYALVYTLQMPFTSASPGGNDLRSLIERENLIYQVLSYFKRSLTLTLVCTFVMWSCVSIYRVSRFYFSVAHISVL